MHYGTWAYVVLLGFAFNPYSVKTGLQMKIHTNECEQLASFVF